MASFTLDIVTPDRVLLHEESTALVVPGALGSLGILPKHAPLLAQLASGEARATDAGGREHRLAVHCGFVQVSGDHVTVLADAAERAEDIDVDRARRALGRAEEAVREAGARFDDAARAEAEAARARARTRLKVAGAR